MNEIADRQLLLEHDHVYLGAGHDKNERKTWAVIVLCSVMMVVEITGGSLFGSLALVADGLHMSTHASAMLIAALAYTYARKHAHDRRFVFGTGKLGDLAGFTSAIILAMIALLIGYEAVERFLAPVPIRFTEAIPIAVVGLLVNIVSAWLLRGDHHGHSHRHGHGHGGEGEHDHEDEQRIQTSTGAIALSIFEDGVPPVFRLRSEGSHAEMPAKSVSVTTTRPDGARQAFAFVQKDGFLESQGSIPEPHAFQAEVTLPDGKHTVALTEQAHGDEGHAIDSRDHNIRAAYIHVIGDAAVSVLAIIGLSLAKFFGWMWMDPVAGCIGALVIANWSYGLTRDTGAILMDVSPKGTMVKNVRAAVESTGDRLVDLHVWRLGPGHFGAVITVVTPESQRGPAFYHALLRQLQGLSHITVEVHAPIR